MVDGKKASTLQTKLTTKTSVKYPSSLVEMMKKQVYLPQPNQVSILPKVFSS
jgi:hypothetical protein